VQRVAKGATFPYARNERFLSPAESSFLAVLRVAVADEYEIFAKVRLLDILSVTAGESRQAAFNRVQAKQLDFLLCERGTSRPVLALELDDSSHLRSDRKARDAFVEEVLEIIGLPVLRCPVTRTYDPREVARLIKATLSEMSGP
jgi:very-short-patch-repair endonuclease